MALQYSIPVNNARLNQLEAIVGTAPLLKFYTGAPPANCGTAASGTLLASFALPSDWLNAASGSTCTLLGTWSGAASAAGTIGYFRITDSAGTNVGCQGTVAIGSGDLQVDNNVVAVAQVITVTAFTRTSANQ